MEVKQITLCGKFPGRLFPVSTQLLCSALLCSALLSGKGCAADMAVGAFTMGVKQAGAGSRLHRRRPAAPASSSEGGSRVASGSAVSSNCVCNLAHRIWALQSAFTMFICLCCHQGSCIVLETLHMVCRQLWCAVQMLARYCILPCTIACCCMPPQDAFPGLRRCELAPI